jgi:2-dehydro-3-deoxyphosphogluconate aldolase/(4S)-4-hydroxy-2-oxoglutarate aldolase
VRVDTAAVLTIEDPSVAADLGSVLTETGVRIAEVTLRTPNALIALERMAEIPDLQIGVGTVRRPDQVSAAVDAGATWVMSAALDDEIVAAALRLGATPVPGVATATECHRAHRLGVTHLKLFPANLLGGPKLVDALTAPFPELKFMPSGGVTADNAGDYATRTAVFAIASGWMVEPQLVETRNLDEIARRCRLVVEATTASTPAA